MRWRKLVCGPAAQCGSALLVLLLILVTAALSLMVGQLGAIAPAQRDEATMQTMATAKAALIGRAASDGNHPGSLPCPDTDDDGIAELFSGTDCPAYLGRLPWKTLELGDLHDDASERLWYALAPALRDNDVAQPINAQKPLELSFDGHPDIAAVIFSPGPPLPIQSGRPGNLATSYLDGTNSDGDQAYVSGPRSAAFNDKALAITRDELFGTVSKRVLAELRGPADASYGLRNYYVVHGAFPWADTDPTPDGIGNPSSPVGKLPYGALGSLPPWLSENDWFPLVTYDRSTPGEAKITIGSSSISVLACPTPPCP